MALCHVCVCVCVCTSPLDSLSSDEFCAECSSASLPLRDDGAWLVPVLVRLSAGGGWCSRFLTAAAAAAVSFLAKMEFCLLSR